MSIRLRQINGVYIAICAAVSEPKEGDVYLHDGWHEALATKFSHDWHSNGLMQTKIFDERKIKLVEKEEDKSNPYEEEIENDFTCSCGEEAYQDTGYCEEDLNIRNEF